MRLTAVLAASFSLLAGAALACPADADCGRMDHHRHPEGAWRAHGAPPCLEACGEITLPASFFYDAGGVGPIPDSGFIVASGGFAFADGGAFARSSAFAGASARASAHVNASVAVRFRGGFKGGHGHKGGKGR